MKKITLISSALIVAGLFFASCQRSGGCDCKPENPTEKQKGSLKVASNIVQPATRALDNAWEVSDAIGIYAIKEGTTLAEANIIPDGGNRKYTTANAGARVNFTSIEGIIVPNEGNIDLISYYPYKEGITGFEYTFNNSDQSNLAAIDLLYSNNQKAINKSNLEASLVFKHALSLVQFEITAQDGLAIAEGATVQIKDVAVDGKLSLVDGKVATGSTTASPKVTIKNNKAMMILPPQALNGKEVVFTINGKEEKATLSLANTEQGFRYIVKVNYTKAGVLIVSGATIEAWKEGEQDVIQIGGGTVTPTPSPEPNPQPEPNPEPAPANLLFPGSDFEDWNLFKANINQKFGVQAYATQADGGKTGKAMHVNGTPKGNDYLFTAQAKAGGPTTATKITLYIKGTAGKSLSFNVYSAPSGYKPFNLGAVSSTQDVMVAPAPKNQYTGAIDTKGEWVKVTLNIADVPLATTGALFAIKVGKEVAYDLLIDDITIE